MHRIKFYTIMKKTLLLAGMLSATMSFAQGNNFNFEKVAGNLDLPSTKDGSLATAIINGKRAVLVSGNISDRLPRTWLYLYNGSKFVRDTTAPFQSISKGQSIFVDIDKDGDEDVALIGIDGSRRYFITYENNGGTFTKKQDLSSEGLSEASINAGDYNNDGYPDFIITGSDRNGNKYTLIYDNNNGTFTKNTNHNFKGVYQGDAKFLHTNGDGKLDVVLTGDIGDNGIVHIYTQNDAGTFVLKQNLLDLDSQDNTPYGYTGASIAVGNLSGNGEGYSDFVIIGRGHTDDGAYVFKNEKDETDEGRFIPAHSFGKLYSGGGKNAVTIADLNKDGKNDIVFASGNEDEGTAEIFIYKNTSPEGFVEFTRDETLNSSLEFGQEGSVLAFDYDEDGDTDLFVTGMNAEGEIALAFLKNNAPTLSNKEVATKASVELYPNPVSNEFRLKGIDKVSQISIYDMSGRLVKTFASQSQYNISGLAKGTYIVLVKGDKGTHQFKIVKN